MAGEERDARLILRAEDRASKTFDAVAASIKKVRAEIAAQSRAAEEGTADIGQLQRQLEELKQAGDSLIQGQSLIRQFDGLSESANKAEARLREATAALAAYREKIGNNPTDNQSNQLTKKIAAVERAEAKVESFNQRIADVSQRLGTLGLSTDNTARDFARIGAAAQETAQGIAQVKNQIDQYPQAVKRATAAAEEFAAAQTLAGKDLGGLKPDQFEFIQSLDGAKAKVQALADIEQRESVAARAYITDMSARWQMQLRSLQDVERQTKTTAAATAKAAADESARVADLSAFRQVGTDAAEAAVKTERYAASVSKLGNDFQSFSASVRTALGGTQTALQDVNQALIQIDGSAETLTRPKAKINELQESAGKLTIAIATLDRTARQIDGFREAQQTVAAAEATFAEAQQEVLRLARAMEAADAPTEALAQDMVRAERALDAAGRAMQRDRNIAVQLGEGLRKAGIDTQNLNAEMNRLQIGATKAGNAAGSLQGKLRGKGGFLGLNAFEVQNLGYQVNDVFTQIGSGTPILQVVAQQGGQIIQIFQGLGGTLLRLAPVIGGVVLLLSPLIGALVQASRAADSFRQASVLLAGTGEINPNAVAQYTEAGIQLRNLGIEAKDAQKVLQEFHQNGLNPAALEAYAQALADASKGGADLSEASKLLAEALAGGSAEVEALNDKFNILTPSEETQIAKMIESGNESEARRIVFEKFEQTAQRMADSANGPWSTSWDNLTLAFNNFTRAISDSGPFRALGRSFDYINSKIRESIDGLSYFFNYASKRGFVGTLIDAGLFPGGNGQAALRGGAESREAAAFANRRGRPAPSPFPAQATGDTLDGERAIRKLTKAQEEQQRSLKKLNRDQTAAAARRKALAEGKGSREQRERQADIAAQTALLKFDDDAAKAAARNSKKKESAANKAAKAAETLANQRRTIEEQLTRDLDGIEKKVADGQLASIEERRAAILEGYTGLFQKVEEARRKGVTKVGGQSLDEYEKSVRAQLAILQNTAELKGREEQVNETIKARGEEIKNIQDQLDRGDITPQAALQAFSETISKFGPQITKLNTDALAFAKSLRGAVPDPKLEAVIAKLERLSQQNSGGQDAVLLKGLNKEVFAGASAELDQLVAERQALVQAETALVELGVKPRREAQAAIEAAYARTNPLIEAQIAKMKELLAVFKDDPALKTFYDTWIAKLEGVAAASTYVDARFTELKTGFDTLITQNAVTAIDTIAQSFANLALDQQSAVDTLLQVGAAFLNFIAQTIIGIAKLIIQMIILDAVQKITGIPVGALLKFSNAAGLHTGGVVGQEKTFSRSVPSLAFANAPRYHGGGVAGFAPDEVPAILKRNEEVLTTNDPRHRFNQSGKAANDSAANDAGTRQVLVLDPAELANAMAGAAGEKVVMTHIRRNQTTLKQLTSN